MKRPISKEDLPKKHLHPHNENPSMKHSTFIALASATLAGHAIAQTYCRPTPWFNPSGTFNAPFSNVAGAVCAAPSGGTISIATGTYYESGITLNTGPKQLTTTTGPVLIGSVGQAKTSLQVISYSTHIYGPASTSYSHWQDAARSQAIGQFVSQQQQAGVDIVGLQDHFDDDLTLDLALSSAFSYRQAGNGRRNGASLGSGLVTLANATGTNGEQALYSAFNTSDAIVSRSYLRLTFVKDGFGIGHFNTSLQRGTTAQNISTRATQIQILAAGILAYRQANPTHVVIVTGSLNASGSSTEYSTTMSNQMGGVSGAADVAPNLACVGAGVDACTTCGTNDLRNVFGSPFNVRNDYIFYADSWDGQTRIVPKFYNVLQPANPATLSGPGLNADTQSNFTLTSTELSDHEAIFASFDLIRK